MPPFPNPRARRLARGYPPPPLRGYRALLGQPVIRSRILQVWRDYPGCCRQGLREPSPSAGAAQVAPSRARRTGALPARFATVGPGPFLRSVLSARFRTLATPPLAWPGPDCLARKNTSRVAALGLPRQFGDAPGTSAGVAAGWGTSESRRASFLPVPPPSTGSDVLRTATVAVSVGTLRPSGTEVAGSPDRAMLAPGILPSVPVPATSTTPTAPRLARSPDCPARTAAIEARDFRTVPAWLPRAREPRWPPWPP
jgi:hypothetical protein